MIMKLQLASDLHLEFLQRQWPGERLITPAPGADLLVLAGDIANGTQVLELFADWPVPVLYLAGNHEFYGESLHPMRERLRKESAGTRVHFFDNDRLDLEGVRFLGCTLWTDYRLDKNEPQRVQMARCERALSDHWCIRMGKEMGKGLGKGTFTAQHALHEHEHSIGWLKGELAKPFDGPTVVMSHHGPHPRSIHRRYAGHLANAGFVSDLTDLMPGVALWLHGHVHDSFDYIVGDCRVVANPRGYGLNRGQVNGPTELEFENPAFDGGLVLEVGRSWLTGNGQEGNHDDA